MSSSSSASSSQVPSGMLLKIISPEESEFLAAETMVTITSNIAHQDFHFVSGSFGPLYPGMPCDMPLWLALQLRRTGKCTIVVPEWMTVARLEASIEDERKSERFSELPFHYIEIAQLLMTYAREDIHSPDQVQVLLQDLESIRMDRIKLGLMLMAEGARESNIERVNLDNISSLEVLSVKTFMTQSMSLFDRLIDKDSVKRGILQQDSGALGSSGAGQAGAERGGQAGAERGGPARPLRRFRQHDEES